MRGFRDQGIGGVKDQGIGGVGDRGSEGLRDSGICGIGSALTRGDRISRPSGFPTQGILKGKFRNQGTKNNGEEGKRVKFGDEVAVQTVEGSKIGDGVEFKLGFQVADVQKLLVSVKRILEKGNLVQFGPGVGENYIFNKGTGDKLLLKPNGKGSYLMEVGFVGGGKTSITVDSGAEENVCPWGWGEQSGIKEPDRWMTVRSEITWTSLAP
jgi:hypothetical protein